MKKEIIPIEFKEGRYNAYDESLKQWNQGQHLEISGLDISDEIVEVHFSLQEVGGTAKRMLGTVTDGILHVDIPAFIMEGPEWSNDYYSAYAWIYLSDEESAETVRKIEFTIEARPKPEEYVTPDEPDTFIEQIKKIMNETKKIAQSVRDDADNGEFDGEKGPKGDAGSVHFLVVNELPEENIDESAIYLVPITLKGENNEYAEYIYVNGHWECIGSATVDADLSEYAKKKYVDDLVGSVKSILTELHTYAESLIGGEA